MEIGLFNMREIYDPLGFLRHFNCNIKMNQSVIWVVHCLLSGKVGGNSLWNVALPQIQLH